MSDWDARLEDLAARAERERWDYVAVPQQHPLPVLDGYVRQTLARVHELGRVAEVSDRACFNTGLLTPDQAEIFGVFTTNENYDASRRVSGTNKKWSLASWACSGDRILTVFRALPEMASYWSDPGELVLDPALHVEPNIDHILRNNLHRFPVELGGRVDTDGVPLDRSQHAAGDAGGALAHNNNGNQPDHQPVPLATRNALDGAVKHSIRLARRSYRVAVPQFHHGHIQLLLPLYLRSADRPDVALTLERHGDWYRA
ncbi:MAG TPA: DUF3825 domain-containing protein, partial [Acidimicrobiales bacterium]|nr:DUF3825 domain-containing protein [Acidimicrobiales bacterium]